MSWHQSSWMIDIAQLFYVKNKILKSSLHIFNTINLHEMTVSSKNTGLDKVNVKQSKALNQFYFVCEQTDITFSNDI